MDKCNSIEVPNIYQKLSYQTKFRLNEITKTRGYFNLEIEERKILSKRPGYFDQTLIVLYETSGRVSIISFVSVIGAPAGIASAFFNLVFSFTTEIIE